MIALEVSSGASGGYGGVPGAIRNLVGELVRIDPHTRYALCSRFSRWRRGQQLPATTPNTENRVIQDPFNAWLLRGAVMLHSMGIFLPKTPRIPKLVTIHDLNAVRNRHWVSAHWHERRSGRIEACLERADHVVTYSQFTAGELQEEYGLAEDRVHPVPLGVDLAHFHPVAKDTVDQLRSQYGDYVLSIGLQTPRKNFVRLIEAIAALPKLNLVLVGRASDGAAELRGAIERQKLESRVFLLDKLTPDALTDLIGSALAYVVPSLYEGFGLTVLEAMACRTPVVCSESASLPEVAGGAAYMVNALDVDALRHGIESVTHDSALAEDLRHRGYKRAELMSWNAAATRLRELYRSISGV